MKPNGHPKNGSSNGIHQNGASSQRAQVSPAAAPLSAAGEADFFTMSRSETAALYGALREVHIASAEVRAIVRRMFEALNG